MIRRGAFPVLMVNNEAQLKYRKVVAPVDLSEASANALRIALSTGLVGDNRATLVHAFSALWKGKMFVAGTEQAQINTYVESERQRAMDELTAFLVANDLKEGQWSLRLEEGGPMEIISRVVAEVRPDLLVMGTHGRSAIIKVLIGSVTEESLRSLNVDILAVPLPKG